MGSDDVACNVTMATMTPPRSRLDAATLKYTAVKVDVSAVTQRCKSKVFVISSQTTSRDLADMVLRKLKHDVKSYVTNTCLLGQSLDGSEKVLFSSEEKVLGFYGSNYRNTVTLELVPAESVTSDNVVTSSEETPHEVMDKLKSGNVAEYKKNGMTLPGYQKPEVTYSGSIGSGFITSTPNPDNDSVTSDSGFLIHYEPYCDNTDSRPPSDHNGNRTETVPARSRSFELARDGPGDDRLNTSSGNASDSGVGSGRQGSGGYHYRPSPQDGFQILQSQNSAWTPFSRHVSEGVIGPTQPSAANGSDVSRARPTASVNDVRKRGEILRRRSLPKMNLSQEQLQERKRHMADVFSTKLQRYLSRRAALSHRQRPPLRRNSTRDDDTVSVTSEEVAEIMSSASPMRPYEDDVSETDTSRQEKGEAESSPKNVFQPVSLDSVDRKIAPRQSSDMTSSHTDKQSISEYAEKSMTSFLASNGDSTPNRKCSVKTSDETPSPGDYRESRESQLVTSSTQQGVPLFTLLVTHFLALAVVRRQVTSSSHTGVRLCDVSYVKCVRYVVRHWPKGSRQLSIESRLADRMLVAVSSVDRHLADVTSGSLNRGDVVVEINGISALTLTARDVIIQMLKTEETSLVVARARLNVERAQSP